MTEYLCQILSTSARAEATDEWTERQTDRPIDTSNIMPLASS